MSATATTADGKPQLSNNVVDVSLVLLGVLLLPLYFVLFRFDPRIFLMVQCTHVILLCLYALLYINLVKGGCFGAHELRFRAFNVAMVYTMFLFFVLFAVYAFKAFR